MIIPKHRGISGMSLLELAVGMAITSVAITAVAYAFFTLNSRSQLDIRAQEATALMNSILKMIEKDWHTRIADGATPSFAAVPLGGAPTLFPVALGGCTGLTIFQSNRVGGLNVVQYDPICLAAGGVPAIARIRQPPHALVDQACLQRGGLQVRRIPPPPAPAPPPTVYPGAGRLESLAVCFQVAPDNVVVEIGIVSASGRLSSTSTKRMILYVNDRPDGVEFVK